MSSQAIRNSIRLKVIRDSMQNDGNLSMLKKYGQKWGFAICKKEEIHHFSASKLGLE